MIYLTTAFFFMFTNPIGEHVYINKESVGAVVPASACDPRAHSSVLGIGQGQICLRETPDQVIKKLRSKDVE